jgi:hypothetical protein
MLVNVMQPAKRRAEASISTHKKIAFLNKTTKKHPYMNDIQQTPSTSTMKKNGPKNHNGGINPELIHALFGPDDNPYRQTAAAARIHVDYMTLDWRDMMFLLNFVQTVIMDSDSDDPAPRKSLELCFMFDIILTDAARNLLCNFLDEEATTPRRSALGEEGALQPGDTIKHVMSALLRNTSIKSGRSRCM